MSAISKAIDYDKLKVAHALAEKLSNQDKSYTVIGVSHTDGFFNEFSLSSYGISTDYKSIDDLLEKLQELTKPKPKYEVGQEVWLVSDISMPVAINIEQSRVVNGLFEYLSEHYLPQPEAMLYPSRQALIEAQLTYWSELLHGERYPFLPTDIIHKAILNLYPEMAAQSDHNYEMTQKFEGDIVGFKSCEHEWDKCAVKAGPDGSFKRCQHCKEFYT